MGKFRQRPNVGTLVKCIARALFLYSLTVSLVSCTNRPEYVLRLGINTWPGYEYLYLAKEKGFFQEEGLTVRLVEFSSLSDCRRAYERGQVDGITSTIVEVLQVRAESNRHPRIVYAVDYSNGADSILAQPAITSTKMLKGKKVGVELDSLGVYMLARALELQGMKLRDVEAISMDQLSMTDEFKRGEIDAAVTYPPASIHLARSKQSNRLFSSAEIPAEIVDVIAIDQTTIATHRDAVRKLLKVYRRAHNYASKNKEDAYRIMGDREGLSGAQFEVALNDGIKVISPHEQAEYFRPGGKIDTAVARVHAFLRDQLSVTSPGDATDLVDGSFAQAEE